MSRLPLPGGDAGKWGIILNSYLSQSHTSDGNLKDGVVGSSQLAADSVTGAAIAAGAIASTHIANGAISKAHVGLSSVDNTADIDKPVSTAAQAALDAKLATATLAAATAAGIGDDIDVRAVAVDTRINALVPGASTSAAGKVELATTAEAIAGTDAARAITPVTVAAVTSLRYDDPFRFDSTRCRAFRAALALRSTTPVDILFIGDSNTEGYGSIGANQSYRWLERLRDGLRDRFQPAGITGGEGYVAGHYASATMTDRWALTVGTGTDVDYGGLGRRIKKINMGATASLSFNGTGLDIYWSQGILGPTFRWAIDGGAESADIDTYLGTSTCGHVTSITGLSAGPHTATVRHTGADVSKMVHLEGAMVYNGDETRGIRVWDGAHTAYRSGDFVPYGGLDWASSMATVQPDLVFITLGSNDYGYNGGQVTVATMKTNLAALIANVRSKVITDPSIVLGISPEPYENSTVLDSWANYRAALLEVAASDGQITVFDMALTLGNFNSAVDPYDFVDDTDSIHYTRKGHQAIADAALNLLTMN